MDIETETKLLSRQKTMCHTFKQFPKRSCDLEKLRNMRSTFWNNPSPQSSTDPAGITRLLLEKATGQITSLSLSRILWEHP